MSDPRTWTHLPRACPTESSWLIDYLTDQRSAWETVGLGWWVVHLKDSHAGLPPGSVIGMGGVSPCRTVSAAWNLGYRLSPAVWGMGLGTELAEAGLRAAHEQAAEVPVTARVLERNPASWRVLDKIGLTHVWSGEVPADDELTSGVARRIYADRPLDSTLLDQLIALG